MSTRQTLIKCGHCGCKEMVAYQNDDDPPTIYVECEACGATVVTAREEA